MSLADQKKFLKSFDEKLSKKVAAYRRMKGNRQAHTFVASKTAIRRGIIDSLKKEFQGNKDSNKQISAILSIVDRDITTLISQITTRVRNRIEGDSVVVGRILRATPDRLVAWFAATKQENGSYRNIYKQVYTSYNTLLDGLAEKVAEASIKIAGSSPGDKAKEYWNLEHGIGQGISESLVKDAMVDSLKEVSSIEEKDVLDWLKNSNVDISIVRDTKTNQMIVFIGSRIGNLEEAFATRTKAKQLKEVVAGARKLVEEEGIRILNLPGSDSFVDIKRKVLLKKVTDEFKGSKNTKVILREKVTYTKKKDKTNSTSKRKVSIEKDIGLKKAGAALVSSRKRKVKKGVASSPLKLLTLINAKLPKQVMRNMGPPALENITGRFASSVRAVDITQTAQGFPSIGYTYQRNPYEVFESTSGTRFSSVDRDPRILIDRSMREIAAELALGRFYTRRV